MPILECKNIVKIFAGKPIINGVSLELEEGCFVSIMGRSGAGKSTLLRVLCGLIDADSGEINIAGYNVHKLSGKKKSVFRSTVIGIVFQDSNLISDFNVEGNILTPLYISGQKLDKEHYDKLLTLLEIKPFLKKMPSQISGGMRQRAAVARALVAKPKILFADEPTGALDSKSEKEMMRLFTAINKEFGTSIIQVTHSDFCAKESRSIIRINDGQVTIS